MAPVMESRKSDVQADDHEWLVLDREKLFQRHDWVWVPPGAIDVSKVHPSLLAKTQDFLDSSPLVVARRSQEDVAQSILRLGLCLPNDESGKPHRIALSCSESYVMAHRPSLMLEEIQNMLQLQLPESWLGLIQSLNQLQLRFSVPLRIYGSLAWQAQHQGQFTYTHQRSDLDLLIIPPAKTSHQTQCSLLQALQDLSEQSISKGGPRVDGEIRHEQLGDLSWQEWLQASESEHIRVLSKGPSSVRLVSLHTQKSSDSRKKFNFHPDQLDEWAIDSLTAEAMAWPKPGLVTPVDNGSHHDMDIQLLLNAIASLRSWFGEFARAAQAGAEFNDLAAIGRAAERVMLHKTQGVNVYRGAIFNLGLLVASAAIASHAHDVPSLVASRWGESIMAHRPPRSNHGEQLRTALGSGGALQEAANGFPTLSQFALPAFLKSHKQGYSDEGSLIASLMASIQFLEDTNLIWRGGLDGLAWAQQQAEAFNMLGGISRPDWGQALESMHGQFVDKNLSPGGSADIAACAFFLSRLTLSPQLS